jgi:hypothetical protein
LLAHRADGLVDELASVRIDYDPDLAVVGPVMRRPYGHTVFASPGWRRLPIDDGKSEVLFAVLWLLLDGLLLLF